MQEGRERSGTGSPLIWLPVVDAGTKRSQSHGAQSPIRLSHAPSTPWWADRPCPHSEHDWAIQLRRRITPSTLGSRATTTRVQGGSKLMRLHTRVRLTAIG